MIYSLNSSDKKRHIALATIGGVVWGTQAAYSTRKDLLNVKKDYKYWLKYTMPTKEQELNREKTYASILENARKLDKLVPEENCEQREKKLIEKLRKNNKEFFARNKQCFKQQIKDIKKSAKYKIPAKIIGGAAIGLGISYFISYVKMKLFK